MKVVFILAVFSLFSANFVKESNGLPGGNNAREIMRLIATINPKTCACTTDPNCIIHIPQARLININCNQGLKVLIN